MANIKELKEKIRSTKGTLKITMAMKLVSAAKLAKAQSAIQNSRPYSEELEETIKVVSALVKSYTHPYLKAPSENKHSVLLVLSANKGLCGGYNSQLAKEVKNYTTSSGEEIKVYFIGRKVKELIKNDVNVGKSFSFSKAEPSFKEMEQVSKELADLFTKGEFGRVYVAYNVFQSAMSFTPTIKKILPLSLDEHENERIKQQYPFDFKYDVDPKELLDSLIQEAYLSSVYTCLLDAIAAEHGSRMTAMDSAVTNCKDVIRSLTLKMNKLRQAAITTELIEVVSGAESLSAN